MNNQRKSTVQKNPGIPLMQVLLPDNEEDDWEPSRTERRDDGHVAHYAKNRRLPQIGEVLHCTSGPAVIERDGTQKFYFSGVLHRDKGPAWISGDQRIVKYYQHGKLHRVEGPALVDPLLGEYWYLNNTLHRGLPHPAVTHPDGSKEYWVHGRKVTADHWEVTLTEILAALEPLP